MLDLPSDELALLLRVLPTLLQRRDLGCFRAGGVADLLRDRGHLLGALAEDVTLELFQRALHGRHALGHRGDRRGGLVQLDGGSRELYFGLTELRLQGLGPVTPLATVIAITHPQRKDHAGAGLSMGRGG